MTVYISYYEFKHLIEGMRSENTLKPKYIVYQSNSFIINYFELNLQLLCNQVVLLS